MCMNRVPAELVTSLDIKWRHFSSIKWRIQKKNFSFFDCCRKFFFWDARSQLNEIILHLFSDWWIISLKTALYAEKSSNNRKLAGWNVRYFSRFCYLLATVYMLLTEIVFFSKFFSFLFVFMPLLCCLCIVIGGFMGNNHHRECLDGMNCDEKQRCVENRLPIEPRCWWDFCKLFV